MRTRRSGWTMVEIMTVVAIMGLLFSIAAPTAYNYTKRKSEDKLRGDLHQLRIAVYAFRSDTGYFPNTLSDLAATSAPATGLIDKAVNSSGAVVSITAGAWRGPYVTTVPTDPITGTAYVYTPNSASGWFVTSSSAAVSSDGTVFNTW